MWCKIIIIRDGNSQERIFYKRSSENPFFSIMLSLKLK